MVRAIQILKERQAKDPYKNIGSTASAPPDYLIRTEAMKNMNLQTENYPTEVDYGQLLPSNSSEVFKLS